MFEVSILYYYDCGNTTVVNLLLHIRRLPGLSAAMADVADVTDLMLVRLSACVDTATKKDIGYARAQPREAKCEIAQAWAWVHIGACVPACVCGRKR